MLKPYKSQTHMGHPQPFRVSNASSDQMFSSAYGRKTQGYLSPHIKRRKAVYLDELQKSQTSHIKYLKLYNNVLTKKIVGKTSKWKKVHGRIRFGMKFGQVLDKLALMDSPKQKKGAQIYKEKSSMRRKMERNLKRGCSMKKQMINTEKEKIIQRSTIEKLKHLRRFKKKVSLVEDFRSLKFPSKKDFHLNLNPDLKMKQVDFYGTEHSHPEHVFSISGYMSNFKPTATFTSDMREEKIRKIKVKQQRSFEKICSLNHKDSFLEVELIRKNCELKRKYKKFTIIETMNKNKKKEQGILMKESEDNFLKTRCYNTFFLEKQVMKEIGKSKQMKAKMDLERQKYSRLNLRRRQSSSMIQDTGRRTISNKRFINRSFQSSKSKGSKIRRKRVKIHEEGIPKQESQQEPYDYANPHFAFFKKESPKKKSKKGSTKNTKNKRKFMTVEQTCKKEQEAMEKQERLNKVNQKFNQILNLSNKDHITKTKQYMKQYIMKKQDIQGRIQKMHEKRKQMENQGRTKFKG